MWLFVEVEYDLALPTEAILRVGLLPRDSESATVILFLHVFIIIVTVPDIPPQMKILNMVIP